MIWTQRTKQAMQKPRRATWAAVALAVISVITQIINFVKIDLHPIKSKLDAIDEKTSRIEQKLQDHEMRLQILEYLQTEKPDKKSKVEGD
ncbi:MAG: hypothetical protein AB1757_21275 [Acidobacteriota bacterium]